MFDIDICLIKQTSLIDVGLDGKSDDEDRNPAIMAVGQTATIDGGTTSPPAY